MSKKTKAPLPELVVKSARGAATRSRLLETTLDLLSKEGLSGLRYAHVAKLANVPQALLGYHFPNMESLLMEVILIEVEKLKSLALEVVEKNLAHPRKALSAYIRTPFELAAKDASFRAVFTCFYHLATIYPAFSDLNLSIRKLGRDRILNLITMSMATEGHFNNGQFVSRESLIEMATSIQGIMTGFTIMAASESKADYLEFSRLAVEQSMKILKMEFSGTDN